jgi:hypothetical protein
MMPLTKTTIEKAIRKEFNFSESDFCLSKASGTWYWSGDKVVDFEEACTFNVSLNQISLKQWVDSFKFDFVNTPRTN